MMQSGLYEFILQLNYFMFISHINRTLRISSIEEIVTFGFIAFSQLKRNP